jgi:DNA-binding IclR family transcriptional regulator
LSVFWAASALLEVKVATHQDEDAPRLSTAYLGRAAAVVDLIAQSSTPVHLSDIARGASIPKSSVHRLLGELIELGLVERLPGGVYVPGQRLATLATAVLLSPNTVTHAVYPHLVRLHHSTGCVVTFAAWVRGQVTVLDTVYSPGQEPQATPRGQAVPWDSALARLLLAFDAGKAAEAPAIGDDDTTGGEAAPDDILSTGTVVQLADGIGCSEQAMLLRDQVRRPVGAISIRWPAEAEADKLWLDALQRTVFVAGLAFHPATPRQRGP